MDFNLFKWMKLYLLNYFFTPFHHFRLHRRRHHLLRYLPRSFLFLSMHSFHRDLWTERSKIVSCVKKEKHDLKNMKFPQMSIFKVISYLQQRNGCKYSQKYRKYSWQRPRLAVVHFTIWRKKSRWNEFMNCNLIMIFSVRK